MRNVFISIPGTKLETFYNFGGSVLSTGIVPAGKVVYREISSSAVIQSDHKRPNNWVYNIVRRHPWKGEMWDQYAPWNYQVSHYQKGFLDTAVSNWDVTENRNVAYNRALGRLNEKVRGELDLIVDLAQWRQTQSQLYGHPGKDGYLRGGLLDRYSTFLRKFRSKRLASKTIAEEWLALRYGWQPLISSIYGALDESQNILFNKLRTVQAKARQATDQTVNGQVQVQGATFPYYRDVVGWSDCKINLSFEVPAWDALRWTSLNPVSLAWELLPYSFVVDWFIDIGSMIRNCETALLYNLFFREGYVSEFSKYTVNAFIREGIYNGPGPQSTRYVCNATSIAHQTYFVRTVLGGYPFPRKPSFKLSLGWQRLLSAAALTRVAFR